MDEKIANGKDVEIDLPNVSPIGMIPVSEIPDYVRSRTKDALAVINKKIEENKGEESDIRTQLEGVALGVKKIGTKRARLARRARKDPKVKTELKLIQGNQRELELEHENLTSALADTEQEAKLLEVQREEENKRACLQLRDAELLPLLRAQAKQIDGLFEDIASILEMHVSLCEWAGRLSQGGGQPRAYHRLDGTLFLDVLNERIRERSPFLARRDTWAYLRNRSYSDVLESMVSAAQNMPWPEVPEIPELDDLDGEDGVNRAGAPGEG
ncbi:MAG: hypothetical protein HYY46_07295 [Deltaproteobacteria bacterium]|nr:hypothetical protein [Deltaproteobacteria bacterium]